MPTRLWSLELEGDGASLFIDERGRVVVSTTRTVRSDHPGGMNHLTATMTGTGGTIYSNDHALRCYSIDAGGRVAWSVDRVNARSEAPDGMLVASNDLGELIVIDRDGKIVESRAGGDDWCVIGWNGIRPLVSSNRHAVWIAPHIYSIRDRHLHVESAAGEVLSRTAIPRAPFDALLPDRTDWPDMARFPHRFDLAYHAQAGRLIASHWSLFAWVMSLGLDGTVDWVALPSESCCNHVVLVGDLIAHTSSCGQRLTFFTATGQVQRSHELELHGAFSNGREGVCVRAPESVTGFDARGEQQWRVDVPGVRGGAARDGVLYVMTERLELVAFDVR